MDKELMDKMNEALKVNGKRELSMDEMDKVSGGGLDYYTLIDGTKATEPQLTDAFRTLCGQIGYDSASIIFCQMTGLSVGDASMYSGTDMEKMNLLLNHFYTNKDNGGGYHG